MKVSRKNLKEPLTTYIIIDLKREDYEGKVESILNDYRKAANIPGFRKGFVPMSIIKKKYGIPTIAEEVNKILKKELNSYLQKEEIEILGGPILKEKEKINWKDDELSFEFEIGLAPNFKINFAKNKKINFYQISADKEIVDNQILNYRKQYGKLISQNKIKKNFEITASFESEELGIDSQGLFEISDIQSRKSYHSISNSQVGEKTSLDIKNLFKDKKKAESIFKIPFEKLKNLSGNVELEIKEINERVLAEINQNFFDKIYGQNNVKSISEMEEKIRQEAEKSFAAQSEQKLFNDVIDYLIKETQFDLPKKFLKKWMHTSNKENFSADQIEDEYNKSEKGIRYKLIQEKIIKDQKIFITNDELKNYVREMIVFQAKQYGQVIPSNDELEKIVQRLISNQEEIARISDQLMTKKILSFFKEKAPLRTKKVTFDAFLKQAYGKA